MTPVEHHHRGTVRQRAVDHIAMPGDPADVGRAPVDVVFAQIEDQFVGEAGIDEVTAAGVQHALGLAGGARRYTR